MRVGLFFGSFDPPHIGHVNVVMGAINSNQVDRVLVIPAYQNLWKENSSKFSYRYAMTNASSEDIAFIRSKSKWDSGTAENILRRHTMKYLNPSFYGQQ